MNGVVWSQVNVGQALPKLEMPVPFERVILDAAATQDYFPGHHNPAYAQHQGQRNIYLNTMAIEGLIDRVVTDWAGPHTFIRQRSMQMRASIYAGDTVYGEGEIEDCYREGERCLVKVSVLISTDSGPCVPASLVIELPE